MSSLSEIIKTLPETVVIGGEDVSKRVYFNGVIIGTEPDVNVPFLNLMFDWGIRNEKTYYLGYMLGYRMSGSHEFAKVYGQVIAESFLQKIKGHSFQVVFKCREFFKTVISGAIPDSAHAFMEHQTPDFIEVMPKTQGLISRSTIEFNNPGNG